MDGREMKRGVMCKLDGGRKEISCCENYEKGSVQIKVCVCVSGWV